MLGYQTYSSKIVKCGKQYILFFSIVYFVRGDSREDLKIKDIS